MTKTPPLGNTGPASPSVDFTALSQLPQAVAPELYAGDRTVHIVRPDDLPPDIPCHNVLGWAHDGKKFSPSLYHHFGDNNPVVVLNIEAIAECAESPQSIPGCVESVLLHETSHCFPAGDLAPYQPKRDRPVCREIESLRMKQHLTTEREPWDDRSHDVRFALRACHLYLRSLLAGYDIPVDRLFRRDFQTSEVFYIHAMLGDGLKRLNDPFAAIEAAAVPPRFQRLWNSDMSHMKEQHERLAQFEAIHG